MSGPAIALCGASSPISNTNACPRETGHDGEHYCWGEGKAHGNIYGIAVLTFAGEKVYHLTMEGRTQPEELCALLALMEVVADPERAAAALPEADRRKYRESLESIVRARRDPMDEGRIW